MTIPPDKDIKPQPGGLIRDQGKPESIEELDRGRDVRPTPAEAEAEVSEQRPGRNRDTDQ